MALGVSTVNGRIVQKCAVVDTGNAREPALSQRPRMAAKNVPEMLWRRVLAIPSLAQLTALGVRTVAGQIVQNCAVVDIGSAREPAPSQCPLMAARIVAGMLSIKVSATTSLVQLMALGASTVAGRIVPNCAAVDISSARKLAPSQRPLMAAKNVTEMLWRKVVVLDARVECRCCPECDSLF